MIGSVSKASHIKGFQRRIIIIIITTNTRKKNVHKKNKHKQRLAKLKNTRKTYLEQN